MGAASTVFTGVLAVWMMGCGRIGYAPVSQAGSQADGGETIAPADGAPPRDGSANPADLAAPAPDTRSETDGRPPPRPDPDMAVAPTDAARPPTDMAAPPDLPAALRPFGPPIRIPALSSPAAEGNPSATGDLLELYFMADRSRRAQFDIWVSTRPSSAQPWGSPRLVAELSTTDFTEETPEVAPDGLTIWFVTERSRTGYDVYVSTRPNRSSPWAAPALVAELSSILNDHAPAPSWSLLRMVMHSDRAGTRGRFDILEAVRSSLAAPWGTPAHVTELNTNVYEGAPHLSPDDLTIYFDSNRPGGASWDLYMARRPSVTAPFGQPTPIRELNSPDNEGGPWLSADGRYALFSTDRDGDGEVYEALRQ